MIIPPWIKFIAGGLALVAAAYGGWTAQGWRRDSIENAQLKKDAAALTKASAALYRAAGQFEKDRSDETAASQLRQGELRTIYSRVLVPAACAAPDGVGRVLGDAVTRANARAAGEPLGPVPTASDAADPAGGS